MATQITSSQDLPITIVFQDRKGNPGKVEAPPEWGVDNPNLLSLAPAADGMSCIASAVGPLGTAIVSVQGDGDLGAGVKPIAGTIEIEVTSGGAVAVVLTAGAPTEQPETP